MNVVLEANIFSKNRGKIEYLEEVRYRCADTFRCASLLWATLNVCQYTNCSTKAVFTCVRTRHPLTSSARDVHMCTRPSSVKYVEYRIAFCLSVVFYHCFYGKLLKCVLNVDVMCANHVYHCASITNLYTFSALCCNAILMSY